MKKIRFSKVYTMPIFCTILFYLFLIFSVNLALLSSIDVAQYVYGETIQTEQKLFSNTNINDDFDNSTVIVVIDKYNSGINKNQEHLFSNIPSLNSIEDLTYITSDINTLKYLKQDDFRQIFKLNLSIESKQNVINTINILEQIEGILWVGVNSYDAPSLLPSVSNGSRYSSQWGLHGNFGINAESAWDITTGDSLIKVGVIDSGIAPHPDLNIGNGWDFYNNNSITSDDLSGHGTHVAGIIGAYSSNTDGIVGVNWDVQLIPLQVANVEQTFDVSSVTAAITYAINNNIDILNYSASGYEDNTARRVALSQYKGLFVCSAGNNNNNNDTNPLYPSNYSSGYEFSDRVISVGAIDSSGNVASFSNYGAETVSIFAPGQSIISTYPLDLASSGYSSLSGTSMAAPFVTGVAALAFSKALEISPDMPIDDLASYVKTSIIEHATDHAALADKCVAGGYLNAPSSIKYTSINKTVMSDFGYNGSTFYWNGAVDLKINNGGVSNLTSSGILEFTDTTGLNFTLETVNCSNLISEINGTFTFELKNSAGENIVLAGNDTLTSTLNVSSTGSVSLSNNTFVVTTMILPNDTYTLTMTSHITRYTWSSSDTKTMQFIVNKSDSCVAEGTLITLADGSLKAVEDLTGNEELLVWNLLTGNFDTAPILFIDSDPDSVYEVIKLTFSDGTVVEVIDEHAFWDFNLNKYVFLRADASQYIGHWFNKQTTDDNNNLIWTEAQLISVNIVEKTTSSWSPVTYGHLCYYVNGMLSMPGATEGLINIFDVDPETLCYDEEAMEEDIETYGLFTYAEFSELFPVSQTIFNAFNAQYLKVAIGKGLITLEEIGNLIELYSEFF